MTPLMRQYQAFKDKYPDKILFFRMGDFYEMFGDDAVKAAPILQIALTSRGQVNGRKIPLAGVPYHSADKYLARLLAAGEKVVVVEQVEDPRSAKGIVKRDVVEILTPGTATIDGAAADSARLNLVALHPGDHGRILGMAVLDLSTGRFSVDEGNKDRIIETVRVLSPQEIIYPQSDQEPDAVSVLRKLGSSQMTPFEEWNFDYKTALRELCDFFDVSTLDGFGVGRMKSGVAAAGAVYRYLIENNRTSLDHITRLTVIESDEYMMLDFSTIRNLELVKNLADGTEKDSLFNAVNRTVTAGGARRLYDSLMRPYRKLRPILQRCQAVGELYRNREATPDLLSYLKKLPDLERLAGRLGMRKITPRQMCSIRDGLVVGKELMQMIKGLRAEIFTHMSADYPDQSDLAEKISQALADEIPLTTSRGAIIKKGYSRELDLLKDSIKDAREYIASLQRTERERTDIPSLKVGYNKVFGYYIEVTKIHL
ncbi:MAG: DNA mismatch repair protein MutS, partial [Candidatus Zixiibacteriota bacterium]